MGKNDFKNLCREFDNNVLDVVKQKGFYPMNIRAIMKSLKKNYLAQINFSSLLTRKKNIVTKNMIMFVIFGTKLKVKR